jgi:hypothetical protein
MPGKFEQANDIVIQSGFRNPEWQAIPADQDTAPSAISDGESIPKSERCLLRGRATSGNTFRADWYGLVKNRSGVEWDYLGHTYHTEHGGSMLVSEAGIYSRIAAKIRSGEQSNVDTLDAGYPIDE